ncbi:MAG: PAS domain-containing protein, partial [Salinibacter sp.]
MTDVVLERRGARRRAGGEEARVQITRLLSLLATGLVLLFGLLLRVTNPGATDPMWLRLVLATLLMAFAGGTYVSGTLRRWCVEISWGFLYLLLGWAVVMAGLSGLPGEYALGVLLVYAISGTLILLSSRSMKPVLAFLVVGLLLGSGLLWSASSPETSPAALALSLLSVAALEGTAGRWVIRMRDRFLRQEKELERKNDLLERTQEIADVGAWEYDAASGDTIWTEQVRRITGHPPEAGRCLENVIEVYHPEDRSRVREALGRALENGEPFDLEARIVSRDEERWVNLQGESQRAGEIQLNGSEPRSNGRPEKDAGGGDVARLRGTIQDITERKQREEALRRQKNLLEQTQRLAGGWQVDLETGTVIGSGEFYRIYEMEGEEGPRAFALEDALQFFTDEARPELREALRRCAEQGEPYDLELQIDTAKGNRRWVRTVGAPVETSGGEVTKVAGALQDITERKQRERILQRRRQTIASLYDVTKRLLRAESREAVLGRIHEVLRAVFDYPFFHT